MNDPTKVTTPFTETDDGKVRGPDNDPPPKDTYKAQGKQDARFEVDHGIPSYPDWTETEKQNFTWMGFNKDYRAKGPAENNMVVLTSDAVTSISAHPIITAQHAEDNL